MLLKYFCLLRHIAITMLIVPSFNINKFPCFFFFFFKNKEIDYLGQKITNKLFNSEKLSKTYNFIISAVIKNNSKIQSIMKPKSVKNIS